MLSEVRAVLSQTLASRNQGRELGERAADLSDKVKIKRGRERRELAEGTVTDTPYRRRALLIPLGRETPSRV